MKQYTYRRLGICLALVFGFSPVLLVRGEQQAPQKAANKVETFTGNVVPLTGPLEKFGARLDPTAAPHWLALLTKEGKVYPLIPDNGSQLFFKDVSMRNRLMRLTGRLFADTHLLQVLSVHSFKEGRLHEVYYWCDICAIRRAAPGICECCGGRMELREAPVK
jgi:hypothetical protein